MYFLRSSAKHKKKSQSELSKLCDLFGFHFLYVSFSEVNYLIYFVLLMILLSKPKSKSNAHIFKIDTALLLHVWHIFSNVSE